MQQQLGSCTAFGALRRLASQVSRRTLLRQVTRNAEADQTVEGLRSRPQSYSTTNRGIDDPRVKPIEFSKTRAYDWKARDTFITETQVKPRPRFESEMIGISLLVVVIYCFVREENYWDEKVGRWSTDVPPVVEIYGIRKRIEMIKNGKGKEAVAGPGELDKLQNRLRQLVAEHGETGLGSNRSK